MFPIVILTAFVPICEHRDIWLQTCYDISDLYLKSYSEGTTSHTIRFTFQFRDFISRTICVVSVFSFIASLDINPEAYFSLWCNMLCSDFFYNIKAILLLRVNKDVYMSFCNDIYVFVFRVLKRSCTYENLHPKTTSLSLHQIASSFHSVIFSIYFLDSLIPYFHCRTPG